MHFLVLFCFRIFKVKKLVSCYHNSHISITTACTGFSNTRPVYTTRFVGAILTDIQRKGQNEICCNATEFKKSGRCLCLRLKIWLTIAWITVFIHRGVVTRGSSCKALIGKILVFWIGGRLWEVVAYERRSDMEMRLWIKYFPLYEYYTGEKDGTKISL